MNVKILGPGCKNCERTEKVVRDVLAEESDVELELHVGDAVGDRLVLGDRHRAGGALPRVGGAALEDPLHDADRRQGGAEQLGSLVDHRAHQQREAADGVDGDYEIVTEEADQPAHACATPGEGLLAELVLRYVGQVFEARELAHERQLHRPRGAVALFGYD